MLEFNPEKFMEHIDQSGYELNLNQLLAETPSLIAYYGAQAVEWGAGVDAIKAELSFQSADVANQFRDSFGTTTKAPSQGVVDAYVESHLDIRSLNKKLVKANKEKGLYKNAIDALNTRANALQTISANKRQELDKVVLRSGGYAYGGAETVPLPYIGTPTFGSGSISALTVSEAHATVKKSATADALLAAIAAKTSKLP